MRIAIDTGGTFTDCVYLADGQLRVLKVFSTPADPSQAILEALRQIADRATLEVRHGTTVGTNAMLERKGARVAFVTTAGFEDTIAIGRQTRAHLYDWFAPVPVCIVPRDLRFGVPERVSAEGEILRAPTESELQELLIQIRASDAESVAISLLFSFAQPETERRVEAALRALNLPISSSHRILPEFREYERAATTVVNAYLAPRMSSYLTHLEEKVTSQHPGSRVDVMQSSGGIIPAHLAAQEPVRTVLSGPAGGVIGAQTAPKLEDCPALIDAWASAALKIRSDILVLAHGGPIAEPADANYIMKATKVCHGFYGASSMERLPVETALTEQVRRFKTIGRK